jgi:hypothetical protein
MTSRQSIFGLLLALVLVRGFVYASFAPPWQAPDEPAQFERARAALTRADWNSTSLNEPPWYQDLKESLFVQGFWNFLDIPRPAYSPESRLGEHIALYQEHYEGLYGSRPAYAVIGWPLFLIPNRDIMVQLYLVRLNTVLMNVGIIVLAYLTTRTLFPQDTFLVLGVPALIVFNPQHTHMLSTVNNGNLAELLATAALYFMVRAIVKGFSWSNSLAILVFSLAAMWTKATAYFLPIAIASVGLFYVWQFRRRWWLLPPIGLLAAGLIFYIAPERLRVLIASAWDIIRTNSFYLDPIVPIDLFRGFWALPGWFILELHAVWYQTLAIACLLAVLGLIILLVTKWRLLFSAQHQSRLRALVVLAVASLTAIGVVLVWNAISNSIVYRQGRTIYPVIVPISLFLMLGWRQLIPVNWRNPGLVGITATFFLFDSLVLFYYIIPFFYSRY